MTNRRTDRSAPAVAGFRVNPVRGTEGTERAAKYSLQWTGVAGKLLVARKRVGRRPVH